MTKEDNRCCLDEDTGGERCIIYIGAVGCFCFAFLGFAKYFLLPNPFALVFGIVALFLGILLLVTSR